MILWSSRTGEKNRWLREVRTVLISGNREGRYCRDWLEKDAGKSGVVVMFYFLIWVVMTQVYRYLKIHQAVHLKSVHFSVCYTVIQKKTDENNHSLCFLKETIVGLKWGNTADKWPAFRMVCVEVPFPLRPMGFEGACHQNIRWESRPGRGHCKCRGPEVGCAKHETQLKTNVQKVA